jgi:CubicO group peptidase (beta-lactamase class C family)/Tol biopolymer transport system component
MASAGVSDRLTTALEANLEQQNSPGVQAAVVFPDGSLWAGASGFSTGDVRMTSEFLMAIGSVSKVYTAALILDLVDDGMLSLDDPLTRWVPEAVHADGVTIRHLLSHTSGVASDDPALPGVCVPGSCLSYSNSGYAYLGKAVERATGVDYAHALRARILAPLGLAQTFLPDQETVNGQPATGHLGDKEVSAVDAAKSSDADSGRGASGGIIATAADTARFGRALFSGSLLSADGLQAMLDFDATHGLAGADDCNPSAAVMRRGGEFGESWSHGGDTGYFRSWLEHFPRYGVSVAVNVNSSAVPVRIVEELARAALAEAPTVPDMHALDGRCETEIAVRDAVGNVRAVTETPGVDGMPSWSPDGRSLVWVGHHDGQNDVYTGKVDGTGVVRLTNDVAQDVTARWSPDGKSIALSSDRDGDHEIYLMAPDGSGVRQLTTNDANDMLPAWSPDGSRLAYVSFDGEQHLHVMRADGTDEGVLVGASDAPWWPTWSPDGTRIAYESGGVIFTVPSSGGDPVRLPIPQIRVTMFPAWAPGTDIAFSSDGDLYATAPDGTNLRRLTQTSTTESTPAWSSAGNSIAFELSSWTTVADR